MLVSILIQIDHLSTHPVIQVLDVLFFVEARSEDADCLHVPATPPTAERSCSKGILRAPERATDPRAVSTRMNHPGAGPTIVSAHALRRESHARRTPPAQVCSKHGAHLRASSTDPR